MHNGKRWFLIHYKLCVLRKFSFNLNIQCSFVDRWHRVSRTSILYQSIPFNQPRDFFSAEMITAKSDIQCSQTTYNVELGKSVTVECQSHVKNPDRLPFSKTVEWRSVNNILLLHFFCKTTLLDGVFTRNPVTARPCYDKVALSFCRSHQKSLRALL